MCSALLCAVVGVVVGLFSGDLREWGCILADRTASSVNGYWHNNVVRPKYLKLRFVLKLPIAKLS